MGKKDKQPKNTAICKTQVLLQNVATTFAHQLLVTEMSSLKNKK